MMAKFLVTGNADGRPFEKLVEAQSDKLARELVYSLLGANGGIKRSAIAIASVEKA